MNNLKALQIQTQISKSLNYTPFDIRWLPYSTKVVVVGQTPSSKGIIQIYHLIKGKLDLESEYIKENGFKCWMAPRDIPIGSEYGDLIEEAIKMNTKVGRTDNAPFPNDLNVFLKSQSVEINETRIPPIKKTTIKPTTV